MFKTGIVKDRRYLEHITSDHHPENHNRLKVIYEMLEDKEMTGKFLEICPRFATLDELELSHSPGYISRVAATADRPQTILDPDTQTSPKSFDAAKLAVGGTLELIDRVMANEIDNGFALVRPPGHHAESDRGMGFCLFNNIAIMARYAISRYSLKRILIVDWDLHHGNGTQNAFYNDPRVLYFSTHQFPHYPGTGSFSETGTGDGEGFTVNVPLPGGQGDVDFLQVFERILRPIALQLNPQLVLVSAGFDIYLKDPLGGMNVTPKGFALLTRLLLDVANKTCGGKILFALEGGYHLDGLRECVQSVLMELKGESLHPKEKEENKGRDATSIDQVIDRVVTIHKAYWHSVTA
ncbi:MAG: histone deacetylase [Thermodesulfobacteriota bacterium]|nr:histone deacetylase [Thermodesulfobacteriota bacterium]